MCEIIVISIFKAGNHVSDTFKRHTMPQIKYLLTVSWLYGIFPKAVKCIPAGEEAEKSSEIAYKPDIFLRRLFLIVVKAAYYTVIIIIAVLQKVVIYSLYIIPKS